MENENVRIYANKYRSHQRKLILVLAIILIIFGVSFVGFGIFLCVENYNKSILIIGVVMILAGIFDIPLAIKFNKIAKQKIESYTDNEAYKRYCKIYGITSIEAKDKKNEN